MTAGRPIVIAGLPRSGTTWTQRVLGTCPGTIRVPEPDNEDKYPAAIHAKRALGRYPCLTPGQQVLLRHDDAVEVQVENADGALRAGMPGDVTLPGTGQ